VEVHKQNNKVEMEKTQRASNETTQPVWLKHPKITFLTLRNG